MIHRPTPNLSATSDVDIIRINRPKFYKNSILLPFSIFSKSTSQLANPAALAFPTVSFLTDKFPFFSKFLLMLALALLVFAGQVSAQLLLTHVTDGAAGVVSGQGTLDGTVIPSSAEVSFNVLNALCPGDFDNNGVVDVSDFLLFIGVFGTSSGDATYNALMDMNSSGSIDVGDFLLFIALFGTTCEQTDPDRDALVALYNATNGPNWTNNTNWLSDKPLGEWLGVTTDANGRVTDLNLFNNGISGVLPSELGDLTRLETLWIGGNQLSGSLPSWLGDLTNLQNLQLASNNFSGSLPSWLGDLTNLQDLRLQYNQLSGSLPSSLGDLIRLQRLYLHGNDFSGELPSSLVNLTNLQQLLLDGTRLCVPTDATFQAWLQGIKNKSGVVDCGDGKIYWTDAWTGKIQRANLDGSGVEDLIMPGGAPFGLALDPGAGKMYWTGFELNKIQRANLDGSGVEYLVTLGEGAFGLALDPGAGKMYWTVSDKIQRANLDGGGVEDLVITRGTDNHPFGLALDPGAGKMYWIATEGGTIRCANLNGSGVEDLVTELGGPIGLALDPGAGKMYWTAIEGGKIQRANLDGSGVEDLITGIGGDVTYTMLALDSGAGKMYWPVVQGDKVSQKSNKIQRANLDGSGVEDFITGLVAPSGLALDFGNQGGDGGITPPPPSPDDREALVALYNATNGSGWTDKTNWLSDRPLGEWYGVTANAQDRVTELLLDYNNLTGVIPSELGGLASLEVLVISNNVNLTGVIPSELSSLSNLQSLILLGNHLSGSIPSELGGLTNLETLILSHNNLTGKIPAELGDLANLETLGLSHNNLTGAIPAKLGDLANLEILLLDNNNLAGTIPSELGSLSNLTGLFLEDNPHLSGPLPETLTALGKLQALDTTNTQLCIPADPAFMAWLQPIEAGGRLCVVRLAVSGGGQRAVPGTRLPQPVEVQAIGANSVPVGGATVVFSPGDGHGTADPDVATTNRYGIAQTFWTLGLEVGEQTLTATTTGDGRSVQVVATASDWMPLEALYNATDGANWTNSANWLSDRPIGEWYGVTTDDNGRVIRLNLFRNGVSGELPSELGDLTKLEWLGFYDNNLSGELPESLGNLTNLQVLDLALNRISGELPSWLGNLKNLKSLSLGGNLSGELPSWLGNLKNLKSLSLGNNLSGELPSWLGNLTQLRHLTLIGGLSGELPESLGNLKNLESLWIHSNQLSGVLPASLSKLTELEDLWLENTQLCAPTDAVFQAWLQGIKTKRGVVNCGYLDRSALVALYNATNGSGWTNSANWLSDRPLREWHGVTTDASGKVVRLSLEGNNLKGPIPPQLGNLANLTHLYLTDNNLTGPIPPQLGNLANLKVLSFQSNNLTGPIPPQLGRLANLQDLYLGDNQLTGRIPRDFTLLYNLRYLYLHGNALSELPSSAYSRFGQKLEVLHLHDNDFRGPFPSWLSSLTSLTYLTFPAQSPSRTCLPATSRFRGWVSNLHERSALAEAATPPYCGEGFWYTWRFEQTTTGRSWTGARPFAAHRIRGEPMLLRIFMGMQNNNYGSWAIQSPRMEVIFHEGIVIDSSEPTVEVPAGAIPLWATRDQAFLLDPSYRQSINILIPGHLVDRGDTESIKIHFDPDSTFRKIVGDRMPAIYHANDQLFVRDPFAPAPWVRHIEYRQHYDIMSGTRLPTKTGWFTQDMPPAKVYLMPLVKSKSDDRGMIRAVNDLVRKGPSHPFFWETQNLLPIKDITVHTGRGLWLGYHPTNSNKLAVLAALVLRLQFSKWDDEFDYIVGLFPGTDGIAHPGKRFSVVGYNGGSSYNTLAHELGHNMSLGHAPCGDPGYPNDGDYPWSDGSIGGLSIRGIDLGVESLRRNHVRAWDGEYVRSTDRPVLLDPDETEFIVDGDTPDLMSYCNKKTYPYKWISSYNFDKALNYRQPASKPATSAAPVNALVLSGGRKPDREMFFWPAFVGEARPKLPQGGGQYRIDAQDAQGRELFSFDFDMTEVADGEGASSFVFAVPVQQEWANALVRITLTGPEGVATLDRDGTAASVLLRDSTGEVRGLLHDWADSLLTPSAIAEALGDPNIKGWDVQVSRGIPDASYWKR